VNRDHVLVVLGMSVGLSTAFYLTDFHMLARFERGLDFWMPSIWLDETIPFVPGWIWVYLLYFPFCFVPIALRELWAGEAFYLAVKGFLAQFAAALACFWLVPSRMLQASPESSTWSEAVVAAFYRIDPGFNVFPSLHVANAAFTACLVWRLKGRIIGVAAWSVALLITISTLFVKQHYLADLAAGLALGSLSYRWAFSSRTARRKSPLSQSRAATSTSPRP
jgi:membrane-associated phospholipid phosphatase